MKRFFLSKYQDHLAIFNTKTKEALIFEYCRYGLENRVIKEIVIEKGGAMKAVVMNGEQSHVPLDFKEISDNDIPIEWDKYLYQNWVYLKFIAE